MYFRAQDPVSYSFKNRVVGRGLNNYICRYWLFKTSLETLTSSGSKVFLFSRLPVLEHDTGNILYILTHKRIIKFLSLYVGSSDISFFI